MSQTKHILITGPPGIGKTTLIKKLVLELSQDKNVPVAGFYTEELRDGNNERVGFDVITLQGTREKLARQRHSLKSFEATKSYVGKYAVFPDNFEKLALPLFTTNVKILVLDEIGKMELFSEKFCEEVGRAFKDPNRLIIATIPIANKGRLIPIVETLRCNPNCQLFTVSRSNRNNLLEDLRKLINDII